MKSPSCFRSPGGWAWSLAWLGALLPPHLPAQTPIDVSSTDPTPTIVATAGPDGSLDVAWRRSDDRLMLSTFTGPNFEQGRQLQLNTNLPLLGGLARDDRGNRYVAAFIRETADGNVWANGYRPNTAMVYRIPPSGDRTEILADVNRKEFTSKWPIINPLMMAQNSYTNADLVHTGGALMLALGHNNGQASDIHQTGLAIGIGLDGGVMYGGGGEQHPIQVALAPDGNDVIMAQIFDQGIGLAKLKREGNKFTWSDFVLIYEIPRPIQAEEALQIAGVVPVADGYLLTFSSGKGWLWNFNKAELGTDGSCAIRVMKVARDFDKLPKFDWWNNVRKAQGGYALGTIAEPPAGKSYLRAATIPQGNGRAIVIFEQWGMAPRLNAFPEPKQEGVRAVVIDAAGRPQGESRFHPGIRIQKSSRPVALAGNRTGWVVGDAAGNRLLLHTLDAGLNLSTLVLGQPNAVRPDPIPTPVPVPPAAVTLTGKYVRDNPENEYHTGMIEEVIGPDSKKSFRWRNLAGSVWTVVPELDKQQLGLREDCFYYKEDPVNGRAFKLVYAKRADGTTGTEIEGFFFLTEFYRKSKEGGAGPAPGPVGVRLTAEHLTGTYVRDQPENDYHTGTIELVQQPGGQPTFRWKNKADVSWNLTLELDKRQFALGEDSPYFKNDPDNGRAFKLVLVKNADGSPKNEIEGFFYLTEFYRRKAGGGGKPDVPPGPPQPGLAALAGTYVRDNPDNDYHEGKIEYGKFPGEREPGFRWTNKAGVSWKLTSDLGNLQFTLGEDSPYYKDNPDNGRAFKLVLSKNAEGRPTNRIEGFFYLDEFYRRK